MQKASLQKATLINNRILPTQEQQSSQGQPLKNKFNGNVALSSRQVTTEALHALKYLTLICSKIYYGVMFFLQTIEADKYFDVRSIWFLKLQVCLA